MSLTITKAQMHSSDQMGMCKLYNIENLSLAYQYCVLKMFSSVFCRGLKNNRESFGHVDNTMRKRTLVLLIIRDCPLDLVNADPMQSIQELWLWLIQEISQDTLGNGVWASNMTVELSDCWWRQSLGQNHGFVSREINHICMCLLLERTLSIPIQENGKNYGWSLNS